MIQMTEKEMVWGAAYRRTWNIIPGEDYLKTNIVRIWKPSKSLVLWYSDIKYHRFFPANSLLDDKISGP